MAQQVLVVDDDRNAVKYLNVVLRDHGYDAVSAYDGNEALDKIERAKPDLIVLDVMMPKKTGFVLFRQLKADERYKDIPVLMLTAVSGVLEELEEHMDETFERPYDSLRDALRKEVREMRDEGLVRPEMFVDKPVDAGSFLARVRQLIGN
jgi:two-component system alkaline phosphatase synthesis response regulator PhoP